MNNYERLNQVLHIYTESVTIRLTPANKMLIQKYLQHHPHESIDDLFNRSLRHSLRTTGYLEEDVA